MQTFIACSYTTTIWRSKTSVQENIPLVVLLLVFYSQPSLKQQQILYNIILICTEFVNRRICTMITRYPIFSMRYSVMCKVYTGYHGTSEIEHGLCACMVDNNPLAKARGLSLRTSAQTMLYFSLVVPNVHSF